MSFKNRHHVHTTLMQVTEPSVGRARFLVAHPAVISRSLTFVNPAFKPYEYGKLLVVKFRCTNNTRWLIRHEPFAGEVEAFNAAYGTILANESTRWSTDKTDDEKAAVFGASSTFTGGKSGTVAEAKAAEKISGKAAEAIRISPEVKIAIDAAAAGNKEYDPTESPVAKFTGAPESRWVNGIYVNAVTSRAFEMARFLAKVKPINMLMVGLSGYGKTSIPAAFAEAWDMSFVRMNCASVRDPEEWFGWREARGGETVFVPSRLSEIIQAGNAVVVLDEFNRVEPWLHNTLYPLLDQDRRTVVHDHEIVCGANLIFVMTINSGYEFVGTFALDKALTNRVDMTLEVGPLPRAIEIKLLTNRIPNLTVEKATSTVDVMAKLREVSAKGELPIDPSTRMSLKIAQLSALNGLNGKQILGVTVAGGLSEKDAKTVLDAVGMAADKL